MLHAIQTLKGFRCVAGDRRIGTIEDAYFDDRCWVVRYFVLGALGWLSDPRALISTRTACDVDTINERIRAVPQFSDPFRYSGYPPPWTALTLLATELGLVAPPLEHPASAGEGKRMDGQNLRLCGEVIGLPVAARDGEIGRIEDVLFDDTRWMIRRLVVATSSQRPGRRALVPPACFEGIDWTGRVAVAMLTRSQIEASPPYDAAFRRASLV